MAALDDVLTECVEACRAMRKAFRSLVRRNVEAICRARGIEDKETIDRLVAETVKALNDL